MEAARTVASLVVHPTPITSDDRRPDGMLVDGCFNNRPDARAIEAVNSCELVFGDFFLFDSLLAFASGRREFDY